MCVCVFAWWVECDLFLVCFEPETRREGSPDGSVGFVFKRGFVREMNGHPTDLTRGIDQSDVLIIKAAEPPILRDKF